MSIQPQFKSYAGTLGGSPIVCNVQNDLGGTPADYVIVIPGGTGAGVVVTIGSLTIPVPLSIGLQIPGPVASFTLGIGTNDYAIFAGVGQVPAFFLASGGGGGGGGGAPTTAPYLLNTDTVPGALTAGVAVRNISVPIDFIFPAGAPGGAATPFRLYGSDVSQPPTTGGGVQLPFRWHSTSGEQTVAIIGAEFTDVSTPAHPKAALAFALGGDETLAMLLQLNNLDFTQAMQIQSASRLALSGVGGATVVTLQAAGVVEFAQNTTIQTPPASGKTLHINPDGDLTINSSTGLANFIGHTYVQLQATLNDVLVSAVLGDVEIKAFAAAHVAKLTSHNTSVSLQESTNSLACSGVEIQHIADGASADSAATVGQLNTNASVGYMTFGAVSTGTVADALWLLGGAGWDVASTPQSAKSAWIAVAPGKVQAGRIHADTGPIVGGADTFQRFEVYKNGSATGCFCNLPAGANSGVLVGTFTFVAGDGIGVVATCQGDAGDVGAVGVLCNIAFTNG